MPEKRVTITPGKRLKTQERIKNIADRLEDPGSNLRDKINERLSDRRIQPANDNINEGTLVGAVGSIIVWTLEDYLPGRAGADASIADANVKSNEIVYTVDSNAVIESQARFRAMIDAGTGVSSLWTDDIEVRSIERVKARPARDTYRYKISISK